MTEQKGGERRKRRLEGKESKGKKVGTGSAGAEVQALREGRRDGNAEEPGLVLLA